MNGKRKAAKAAGGRDKRASKGSGRWTTVYVGPRGSRRRALLKSPDGRVFEGTREEVRRAGLLPDERHSLAEGLYINYLAFWNKPEVMREQSAFRRMDAIRFHAFRSRDEDAALDVMVGAAARFLGKGFRDFKREAVLSQVEATMDLAKSERGSYELPMTRQERAALDGLGSSQAEFCLAWKLEGALRR